MSEHVVNLAASALTSWKAYGGKHGLESTGHEQQNKRARTSTTMDNIMMITAAAPVVETTATPGKPELKPYPFFYYHDHSKEEDPDPLTPLTFPGRVPNFPAKLHAILSQPDLADVIDWLPHGRSWRVLKPREFETKVIPRFFEHSKFSSFVRQANGWGFRRITQGPDRNSYYHVKFLRGLPHLCKSMKRPGVAEKRVVDPDLEPDFYKISEIYPVPQNADEESIFLQKTLESGPKARMPIITGHFKASSSKEGSPYSSAAPSPTEIPPELAVESTAALEQAPAPVGPTASAASTAANTSAVSSAANRVQQTQPVAFTNVAPPLATAVVPQPTASKATFAQAAPAPCNSVTPDHQPKMANTPPMNQMAFQFPMPSLDPNNPATSSFAAGFAVATAQYQQHFYAMLNNMAANKQLPEGFSTPHMITMSVPVAHSN
ncbi:Heat stress transcription factor [Seminavis robusta]|uniref:Heat stress transcription factor n=1 Tax=Seminavis robusta TaxID=568900 RepID=A0A9N8DM59_9STRA|nr:Heat stress transcription factor [Seminavis robusta]|eukprot:Sro237_g095240.1 Heat stress transcription factor (434) ;mRNA; r:28623-30011